MSARPDFKGDFMGFTYGTDAEGKPVHSSDLGIVRVSDGSRFNENLLPTIQDKTVQVPGGDGTYYFGSYYTQRQFNVSFAFDSLTEAEIVRIKRHFGDKKIHDLIFDETPYKVWSAKVTGTATIKYIPFEEGSTNRLYKGEGSIQFTCYYPFARCWYSNEDIEYMISIFGGLEEWKEILKENYPNIDEWWTASGIDNTYPNFGDVPAYFKLRVLSGSGECSFDKDNTIYWKDIPADTNFPVYLETKTGLASDSFGNIYNKYFSGNLCAKAPPNIMPTISGDAQVICTSQYI